MSIVGRIRRITFAKLKRHIGDRISAVKNGRYQSCNYRALVGRKVLFDHIPKCGGSTLSDLFRKVYGRERVSQPLMGEEAVVAKKLFEKYDVVTGHLGGTIFDGTPANLFCCTIVRDPVDRALSTYYFFQKLPQGTIPYVETVRGITLDEFVSSSHNSIINEILDNPLTMHFAAASGYCGDYNDQLGVWGAAVRGFNSYDSIGICEDFEKSAQELLGKLGACLPEIDYKSYILNKNEKRKGKGQIPKHIISAIERRNAGDIQLYSAAVERLNGRPYRQLLEFPEALLRKGSAES